MRLYRTSNGIFAEQNGRFYAAPATGWDELICTPNLHAYLPAAIGNQTSENFDPATVLAPIVSQEVWAAGVTYFRSRNARIGHFRGRSALEGSHLFSPLITS